MKDPSQINLELLEKISGMEKKIQELEQAEAEYKRREEQLRLSRQYLQLLINSGPDFFFLKDLDFRYQLINSANAKFFGRDEADILGRIDSELMPPEAAAACQNSDRQAIRENRMVITVEPVGNRFYETRKFPVINGGKIVGVAGIVRDITERKRAEEALAEELANKKAVFEQAPNGILIIDTETAQFLEFNTTAHEQLGYTREEFQKLSIFDVEAQETTKETKERIAKVIKNGRDDFETIQVTKQGEIRNVQVTAQLISVEGRPVYYCVWRDITKRKKAEEALRNSEALLNSIFQASSAGISLLFDRKIIKINHSLSRITGYSEEELVGRTTRHLYLNDEEFNRVGETYKEMARDGLGMAEAHLRRKDGSQVHVLICLSPANPNDAKAGVISTILDISDLKNAEIALKKSEEQYRTLVDNMYDAVYRCDMDGRIIFTTPSAARILGYSSAEELTGLDIAKDIYYNPEKREDLLRILREHGKVTDYEVILRRKDNRPVIISTNSQFYHDKEGNIIGVEGVYTDITERKKAEEALRQSEEMYRTLVSASPDAITMIDLSGRITLASPKAIELFGLREEHEAIGHNILEWIPDDQRAVTTSVIREFFSTGSTPTRELVLKKNEGTFFDAEVHAAPIRSPSGAILGGIFITRDITERKGLQAQLLQSQKMEAIGTLAGGIAHDFNNILMTIMGYTSLMETQLPTDHPIRSYVQQISSCTGKAANITRSLLTFSRKQAIELSPQSTNTIIRDIEKLLQRIVPEDVKLTVTLDDDVAVMADMTQIDQVLINLVSNAKDAMPNGGELRIETKAIKLGREFRQAHGFGEPGNYARISVIDTGCGIDAAVQKKIFEPFFTTKEVGKGTGLGLAIVYGIVKQHGGYIAVSSEPDRGTTFDIYLPAVKAPICEAGQESSRPEGGTETLLLAEDDAGVRKTAGEILHMAGYTVVEATDGADAVRKYVEHRNNINLLILDVVMPGKNGKEAYEEIRKIDPSIHVLFMSGYTGDVVLEKGVEHSTVGYVPKPLSANDLLKKIREVLKGDQDRDKKRIFN